VLERYAPLPDFPRRIRLPTSNGAVSNPRWRAAEVIEFAMGHQDKRRRAA
jgi:hypothetical protein